MRRFFFHLLIISSSIIFLFSCEKDSSNNVAATQEGFVGFDNIDVRYLPIRIIIDGKEAGAIGNPMPVYKDCGNLYVHAKFKVETGTHTFALINSFGYYIILPIFQTGN